MCGLREGDLGDRRHDHAPQPLAPEDLDGRSHRDQPLEWYLRQLQAQLGLGSYKSAWLLLHKLRRAMVDPDRSLLEDLIEIDEATLPFRTACHRRARSQPTRQDAHCRRGRAIARGRATPHPAGADRGFLRAQPSCLRCREITDGRLLRPARPRPPAQGRRCNARPSRADVDPSCAERFLSCLTSAPMGHIEGFS